MQAGVEDQAIAALTRQNEQVVVPIVMKDAAPVVVRQPQPAPAAPRRAPFSLPQAGANALLSFSDLKRAHRVADQVEAGIVWVNAWLVRDLRTPFGGVKASGVGREGGWEALRFFTEAKNVFIKY